MIANTCRECGKSIEHFRNWCSICYKHNTFDYSGFQTNFQHFNVEMISKYDGYKHMKCEKCGHVKNEIDELNI